MWVRVPPSLLKKGYIMKLDIGDIIEDPMGNIYEILDKFNNNTHFMNTFQYNVKCIHGYNMGKTRTVSQSTVDSVNLKRM